MTARPWSADSLQQAWNFAADAHGDQKVPGTRRPYLTHLSAVTLEVASALIHAGGGRDADLALQCAILHDVLEDTSVTRSEVAKHFEPPVVAGVAALTKNPNLPTSRLRLEDSLARIMRSPHEVWMVKMADRIVNLQPPPAHWGQAKIQTYAQEARQIHAALHTADSLLGERLRDKIHNYPPGQGRSHGGVT